MHNFVFAVNTHYWFKFSTHLHTLRSINRRHSEVLMKIRDANTADADSDTDTLTSMQLTIESKSNTLITRASEKQAA